jgi:hypothetical protein
MNRIHPRTALNLYHCRAEIVECRLRRSTLLCTVDGSHRAPKNLSVITIGVSNTLNRRVEQHRLTLVQSTLVAASGLDGFDIHQAVNQRGYDGSQYADSVRRFHMLSFRTASSRRF